MGELLMAVLLVSILWIIWDMAKMFLEERQELPEKDVVREPGRQKLNQYAEAFDRLSEIFLKLPKGRECFTREDMDGIIREVAGKICRGCEAADWCWKEHREDTCRQVYHQLEQIEKGEEEQEETTAFRDFCILPDKFLGELTLKFQLARQNLIWNNRLLESRQVMMDQFQEIAETIRQAAGSIYEINQVDGQVRRQMELQMRLHGIGIREMWKVERADGGRELYVTMRALGKKRCIGIREAAACLSSACGERMIPARDSRMIINHEYNTVMFMPAPAYVMLCGAAKVTREGEVVSGDSFSMFHRDSGQMILSISDGMGSGPEAGQESSQVVELMEQFLNAGFDKETAVRMIHSVMLLKESRCFSTMDLATVNLYTGECELLKVGASTTFLKRGDWVETVSSTSMPMGIMGEADYECCRKQLRPGDFLVMISDGILDAFPPAHAEEEVQDLILSENTDNAGEMARGILEEVLKYRRRRASDDMTVLVGGLWRR